MRFYPEPLPAEAPVQPSHRPASEADHRWSGCDAHNPTRHYRAHFDGSRKRSRLTVHLSWRQTRHGASVDVGAFTFDLGRMLDAGLVREERNGERLALMIVHERETDHLVIRLNESAPRLVIGRLL